MVLFIGLITSYEDIKFGKIRNKWIILGLSWGVAMFILLLVLNMIGVFSTSFFFIGESLVNFIISIIVSYLMWQNKIWAAGDAKLFIIYSLLIPLTFYAKSYLPFFPSVILLINIFVIVLFYIFFKSIYHIGKLFFDRFKENKENQTGGKSRAAIDFKKIVLSFKDGMMIFWTMSLVMLVLLFFSKQIQNFLKFDLSNLPILVFSLFILFRETIGKILKNKYISRGIIVLLVVFVVFGLVKDFSLAMVMILKALERVIIFMIIFGLFQKLVNIYVDTDSYEKINVADLKTNMTLPLFVLRLCGISQTEQTGLTEEQIAKIKKLAQEKNVQTIRIMKIMPFAFWIFFGILVTLIIKGSIIAWFLKM